MLQASVKNHTQILVALRNNRKILARCASPQVSSIHSSANMYI